MGSISIRLEAYTLEEIQKKIADYERSFPSPGYGTYIAPPKWDNSLNKYVAVGSRGATCD